MSLGGSPKTPSTVTQKSTSEPPAFLVPYITGQGLSGVLPTSQQGVLRNNAMPQSVGGGQAYFDLEQGRFFSPGDPGYDSSRGNLGPSIPSPSTGTPGGTDIDPRGFLPRAFDLSQQPYPFRVPFEQVAPFNAMEQQGMSLAAQQAMNPDPMVKQAAANVSGIMGAPSLSAYAQNPYSNYGTSAMLSAMNAPQFFPTEDLVRQQRARTIDEFNTQVVPTTSATFARNFGGSAHGETEAMQRYNLARALNEGETGIRSQGAQFGLAQNQQLGQFGQAAQQYGLSLAGMEEANRAQQGQFAQLAPMLAQAARPDPNALLQLGGMQRGQEQQRMDLRTQQFLQEAGYPADQLALLQSFLGIGSPYQSTTSQNPIIGGGGGGLDTLGKIANLGLAGAKIWSLTSSRKFKADLGDVGSLLDRLDAMPVRRWRYLPEYEGTVVETENGPSYAPKGEHVGPMAEDFKAAFGLGDGASIDLADGFGICIALIKELSGRLRALEARDA